VNASAATLVGTWLLESWETRYEDGRLIYPMGEDALGFLVYSADGYMAATLSFRDRLPFRTGEMLTADVAEKVQGWDSYFSYVGRYSVAGGRVTHHIEASQYPNWVGNDQVRVMTLDDNRLELATLTQTTRRGRQTSHLIWSRSLNGSG